MRISASNKITVAVSMGDPSGIGPEVTLKALSRPRIKSSANFIIVGDINILRLTAARLNESKITFRRIDTSEIKRGYKLKEEVFYSAALNVIDLSNVDMKNFAFGQIKKEYGKASFDYVRMSYNLIKDKVADSLVTAPINKASVNLWVMRFRGHTEYLAKISKAKRYAMMLVGGPLKVSLVTRHIPIKDVSKNITAKRIHDTIDLTILSLKRDFKIERPRIGIAALNPHAGDNGVLGNEEFTKIKPALKKYKRGSIIGPIPADSLFYDLYRGKIDCAVCMYHDQGLIPLKMIARDSGVNITAGLHFVRTSPDHGTAFDIAGKNLADPQSMEEAIRLAVHMTGNRIGLRS